MELGRASYSSSHVHLPHERKFDETEERMDLSTAFSFNPFDKRSLQSPLILKII